MSNKEPTRKRIPQYRYFNKRGRLVVVPSHTRTYYKKKGNKVPHDAPKNFRFRERDLGMGERKLDLLDQKGEDVAFIHYLISKDQENMFGDITKGNIHFSYMEVYQDERKKGYSKILLTKLTEIADKEKLDITLNARGRSLANYYETFGFIETGTIEDSVQMRRKYRG